MKKALDLNWGRAKKSNVDLYEGYGIEKIALEQPEDEHQKKVNRIKISKFRKPLLVLNPK